MAEFEFVNATELMDQIKGMRREYERLVECTANTDVGRIQRRYYLERADALDDVIRTIQMLQRHDAVEITRCRNCVYGPETAAPPGEREARWCSLYHKSVPMRGYCLDGVAKEDAECD